MKVNIKLLLDKDTFLNLNSDFFNMIDIRFPGKNRIEIMLPDTNLSGILIKNMQCAIEFPEKSHMGVIRSIAKRNGNVILTCAFTGLADFSDAQKETVRREFSHAAFGNTKI
jgi:hypothetical protein